MEKQNKNTKKIVLGIVIVAVLVAIFAGVYHFFGPKASAGAKAYTLTVVDDKGNEKKYEATTDAEYLGQALEELEKSEDFTMDGEEGDYGFFITSVNGLEANYDTDGAYWSVYVNDAYAQNGVDSQPINDKDAFSLVYETANE